MFNNFIIKEMSEPNINDQYSSNDSFNEYGSPELEQINKEIEKLNEVKKRLKELKIPTISEELMKKNKDKTNSKSKTLKGTSRKTTREQEREAERPAQSDQKESHSNKVSTQSFYSSKSPNTKNKTVQKDDKSPYNPKTNTKKPITTLRQPLLLSRKYVCVGTKEKNKGKGSNGNKKTREENYVTYKIYVDAFKVNKPVHIRSCEKFPNI